MVEEPGGLCRLLPGPMEWTKTLAWLLSPFSVPLSSAERAQHFLENPEPLVHSPSTAVFAEGTVQPLILPNHALPFSFSFLLLLTSVTSFLIPRGEHVLVLPQEQMQYQLLLSPPSHLRRLP